MLGVGAETAWADDYVGSAVCRSCHAAQAAAWERSDHSRAMLPATPATVAGDFSDVRTTFHGMDTRFFREGDAYWVETVGPTGDRGRYPVRYTFGHRPLQQYLLDRGNGVLQAFDIAWDTRAEPEGQRWYHLQPGEPISPDHPFFWTRHSMNWSSQCADCHSTHVVKAFDSGGAPKGTDYAEANVGCEACHGPAGDHVRLAKSNTLSGIPHAGFGAGQSPRIEWLYKPGVAIAEPHGIASEREIDMCGGCHSLRTPLTTKPSGKPYHEAYRLELPDDVRYFHDGQIKEEVFVLGSFLQSRMHVRGVTCGNCHDPHSGFLLFPGNGLCAQCHRADVYDVGSHHRHPTGGPGSACVDCHMPARTYMGVDDRRDHSFPIPRPALSAELGVPNACVDCHDGRDNQWAIRSLRKWGMLAGDAHWGRIHEGLGRGNPQALATAASALETRDLSPLAAASLLAQAANVATTALGDVLKPWLDHDDPLVRRGAMAGTRGLPGDIRWWTLANRLHETHPGVRFEMAISLAEIYPGLSPAARRAAAPLLVDYRQALAASADLAATQTALARLEVALGQTAPAERAFERALAIDPSNLLALVNFADLRRAQGQEPEAGALLRRALRVAPDSGTANVAYGLHLVRLNRHDEALASFSKAALAPDARPEFIHIYAVALDSLGDRQQALATLREGIERWPWSFDLLNTLVLYIDDDSSPELHRHLDTLETLAPDSPQVRALRERYTAVSSPQ